MLISGCPGDLTQFPDIILKLQVQRWGALVKVVVVASILKS